MRLFILSSLLSIGLAHASSGYAQKAVISLEVKNQTVQEVLDEIEEKSEFTFFFNHKHLNLNRNVSISAHQSNVFEILERVFEGTDVNYSVLDKKIVLSTEEKTIAQQDEKRITGTIVDAMGETVLGANIQVKGSLGIGTITDMDGNFSLRVPVNSTLVISYIGYETQEVKIANKSQLDILLREDTQALDELVVVGYGTQKKINLTGSVEVIGGEQLENRPVSNVTQALQGQVSGANFTAGAAGFEPGAALSFQIRGQGDAYVLVDGVPSDLGSVNPNDIESISVLKDAAAASIYGARASYGVVLITTKSGKNNQKTIVNFSANVSSSKISNLPEMTDSYTFARMLNEAGANGGGAVFNNETMDRIIAYQKDPTLPETVPHPLNPTKWGDLQYPNANYDWFDEFYGNALSNQENISIRGGNEKVSYYASAGHVYSGSPVQYGTDYYRRINTTAKVDFRIKDWWNFSVNNRFMTSDRTKPNMNNEGDYTLLFHQIARTMPTQAKYTPNGRYTKHSKLLWVEDGGTDVDKNYEMIQRFATEIRPIKGWKINADYTFKLINKSFTSNNFIVYEDLVDGTLVADASSMPSYVNKSQGVNFYTSFNAYTSYDFKLKDSHNFSIMAGMQQEGQKNEKMQGRKNDIVTDEVPSYSTSTGDIFSLTDNLEHWSRVGGFFRLGYNYKERYLLEVNGRYDGTSVFAEGNRWGFFPSFSSGWNVSREKFFEKALDVVNDFKIRASWGSLGNQSVDAYQDLALIGISANLPWLIDDSRPIYTTAPNLINQNLTWESSETLDFGIDLGLLRNRLNITADWYQRKTKSRLGPAEALPAVIGAPIPKKNNSELKTNGWEIAVSWRDNVTEDFSYSISAMVYDYYSTITEYNNPTNILTTDYEGKRVGEIWGYTTEGLIQTQEKANQIMESGFQDQFHSTWNTGDVKYADINNDGVVNNGKNTLDDHGDLSVIGNITPRYQFSFNLGAEYKGFDLNTMWQGVAKRDIWFGSNDNMFWGFRTWNQSSLFVDDHLDYYRDVEGDTYSGLGMNTDSYFPRPYLVAPSNNKNRQIQSRYLQNGSYLRLKNLQFGYSLPESVLSQIKLSKLRFYLSGENLLTFTGDFPSSLDPETAALGKFGKGKSMNPQTTISFGVDIQF